MTTTRPEGLVFFARVQCRNPPGMEKKSVSFRLDLPLKSKARPRLGRGRAYLPADYREWKDNARALLRRVWELYELPVMDWLEIHVVAHGHGRGDSDNVLGALLDAGLPDKRSGFPGCWKDDRVTVIPHVSFTWIKSAQQFWDVRIVYRVA